MDNETKSPAVADEEAMPERNFDGRLKFEKEAIDNKMKIMQISLNNTTKNANLDLKKKQKNASTNLKKRRTKELKLSFMVKPKMMFSRSSLSCAKTGRRDSIRKRYAALSQTSSFLGLLREKKKKYCSEIFFSRTRHT